MCSAPATEPGALEDETLLPTLEVGTELSVPGIGKIKITGPRQEAPGSPQCLVYPTVFVNNGHKSFLAESLLYPIHERGNA